VYCCMWCSAIGVVAVVLRSRCVVLCTVCKFVSDKTELVPQLSYTNSQFISIGQNAPTVGSTRVLSAACTAFRR